jgi:NitT/TauT family transport system substrate-binding protein
MLRRTIVLSGIAAYASAAALAPTRAFGQSTPTLNVTVAGADDGTPVLWAIESGMFKKAGLDVKLSEGASGAVISAGVAGGAIDIGMSSLVPVIGARAKGLPFQLIVPAAVYNSNASYAAMLVRNDSPFKTAKDLNGHTIASAALRDLIGTSQAAWIDANGGDSSTVKVVEIPNNAVLPALEEGRIDAATFLEPRMSQALATGKMRKFGQPFDAFGKHFPISSLFGTADFISKNTELVQRFARVVRESNVYCNTHHAETAPVLARFAKLDLKVIENAVRVGYDESFNLKEIQGVIDICARYKVIDKPFEARELVSPAVAFMTKAG